MKYKQYYDGLNMDQFKRVDDISYYNYNYYIGLDPYDLLLGVSDDDRTTEWYLIVDEDMTHLGDSDMADEKLWRA